MVVSADNERISYLSILLHSNVALYHEKHGNYIPFQFEYLRQPFSPEQSLWIFQNDFKFKDKSNIPIKVLPLFVTMADFGEFIDFPLWISIKRVFRLATLANVFGHSLQSTFVNFRWCTRKWRFKLYFRLKISPQISHVYWNY